MEPFVPTAFKQRHHQAARFHPHGRSETPYSDGLLASGNVRERLRALASCYDAGATVANWASVGSSALFGEAFCGVRFCPPVRWIKPDGPGHLMNRLAQGRLGEGRRMSSEPPKRGRSQRQRQPCWPPISQVWSAPLPKSPLRGPRATSSLAGSFFIHLRRNHCGGGTVELRGA
jgi:hypothetical protein